MKMYKYYDIPRYDVFQFVCEHIDEKLIPTKCTSDHISFKIEQDLTKAEYNMLVLNNALKHIDDVLNDDEKAAIEYAIECIKTLDDMGIIKENKDND